MVALLAILVLMPVFWLLVASLSDDATKGFTGDHYQHLVRDPEFPSFARAGDRKF